MIHTEKKFAYRHKPTGKWVALETFISNWDSNFGLVEGNWDVYMHLIDDFDSEILYNARNIIEEDLLRSTMNGERYAAQNFYEFELVEIEIEYRLKT